MGFNSGFKALNCNLGCAYANEFGITVVIDKLRTIAQEAVGFYEGGITLAGRLSGIRTQIDHV